MVVPYMLRSDAVITRLMEQIPQMIVASSQYVATHGRPDKPAELPNRKFVAASPGIRKPPLIVRCSGESFEIPMSLDLSSNRSAFNLEMIRSGRGLGILPAQLVWDDIGTGRLVQILADRELPGSEIEIRLAYSSRALLPAKVRAFIDHASEYFHGQLAT
jgi:DNA-binding transcriptional LysR family regulator